MQIFHAGSSHRSFPLPATLPAVLCVGATEERYLLTATPAAPADTGDAMGYSRIRFMRCRLFPCRSITAAMLKVPSSHSLMSRPFGSTLILNRFRFEGQSRLKLLITLVSGTDSPGVSRERLHDASPWPTRAHRCAGLA
jgi:hypothetical protein